MTKTFTLFASAALATSALVATAPDGLGLIGVAHAAEGMKIPASTTKAKESGLKTAVIGGGCFWGLETVYEHVKGVKKVVNGYAGGSKGTASYERVGRGDTGHAESVQITYDPSVIGYDQLLRIFFSVAHDPTQVNGQTPDHGSEYRSLIVPQSKEQLRVAKAYIAQLDKSGVYGRPIATDVETGKAFYMAEAYHQNFAKKNPSHPYITRWDAPKVAALKRIWPGVYSSSPSA
ncbi:peptide-methionine (S)-S-oxide reductase MsrA [Novosphingopyxis sp.]|uniref:peptide-methionine (S)-S-oxide reductase MsrA n=1 Tax=Novosphingopyxis sp. TaxID=2709690 RepID=UPI003B5A991B